MKKLLSILLCGFLLLLPLFAVSPGASAADSYEEALDRLTSPENNRISDSLRHPFSRSHMLDAMAKGYTFFSGNGMQRLWELAPDAMTDIAQNRYRNQLGDKEEASAPEEEPTEEELKELIAVEDLSFDDPAPFYRCCWYDYAIDPQSVTWENALNQISGYAFTITCDEQAVALLIVTYRTRNTLSASLQPLPNSYRSLYLAAAKEIADGSQYPILLTNPQLHHAMAFLVPKKFGNAVFVKNDSSSFSKEEYLKTDLNAFCAAALNWNRSTLSVLIDANGTIQPNAAVQYNNLESYVRSELRRVSRENTLRAISLIVALAIVVMFAVVIINKLNTMFLEDGDQSRSKAFFLPKRRKKINP